MHVLTRLMYYTFPYLTQHVNKAIQNQIHLNVLHNSRRRV